jgi:hypothetical protein
MNYLLTLNSNSNSKFYFQKYLEFGNGSKSKVVAFIILNNFHVASFWSFNMKFWVILKIKTPKEWGGFSATVTDVLCFSFSSSPSLLHQRRRRSCGVQKSLCHVLLGRSACKLLLSSSRSSPSPLKSRAVCCRPPSFRRSCHWAPSHRRMHSTATYRPLAKLSVQQASPLPCASPERTRLGPFRRNRPWSPPLSRQLAMTAEVTSPGLERSGASRIVLLVLASSRCRSTHRLARFVVRPQVVPERVLAVEFTLPPSLSPWTSLLRSSTASTSYHRRIVVSCYCYPYPPFSFYGTVATGPHARQRCSAPPYCRTRGQVR